MIKIYIAAVQSSFALLLNTLCRKMVPSFTGSSFIVAQRNHLMAVPVMCTAVMPSIQK